jgi:hypothetical protein
MGGEVFVKLRGELVSELCGEAWEFIFLHLLRLG